MELQTVELHFAGKPEFDGDQLKAAIESILESEVEISGKDESSESVLIFHKDHEITYKDGSSVPAQTVIFTIQKPFNQDDYVSDIQQSWATPNADALLAESKSTLLITEMMARGLPPNDRLSIFHGVLQAVVELTRPIALVFKHSQQVIDPVNYLRSIDGPLLFRSGAVNVRFFRIDNSDGDMLMDTRGLTELGLYDLQCHFHNLEPNDVVRLLMNTALYILEEGPVIESGNTIAGIGAGSKFICQFEDALAPPKRIILDINPGPSFAAGNR